MHALHHTCHAQPKLPWHRTTAGMLCPAHGKAIACQVSHCRKAARPCSVVHAPARHAVRCCAERKPLATRRNTASIVYAKRSYCAVLDGAQGCQGTRCCMRRAVACCAMLRCAEDRQRQEDCHKSCCVQARVTQQHDMRSWEMQAEQLPGHLTCLRPRQCPVLLLAAARHLNARHGRHGRRMQRLSGAPRSMPPM
jgi:hypothetical protein